MKFDAFKDIARMEWHGLSLRISGESPLHPQKTRENHGATARITSRSVKHGLDKIYATGRKCAAEFKTTMKILFDDHLPKWNYRAIPESS